MRIKENFNKQLLVEGNDDQHVVWSLCERFQVPENFDVVDCEGINNLIAQIPLRLKKSGFEVLGIIVDADTQINARWQSLRETCIALGFEMPEEIGADGLVTSNGNGKRLGIWLMPNNQANGMLEDFISFLVPANDPLLPEVRNWTTSMEQQHISRYVAAHRAKAVIHSWLALQEDPGTPMGLAITKTYLTTDVENCTRFGDWLTTLFG